MAALLKYFVPPQADWFAADFAQTLLWLAVAILGGAVAYIGVLFMSGMRPAELVLKPTAPDGAE